MTETASPDRTPAAPSADPRAGSGRPPRWAQLVATRRGERRRGRVVVPSALAGVGLALSLPPWGFWVLAFPAAAVLWWRLEGLRWRARLVAGWAAGLGLFVPGLWWALSFNVYGGMVLMVVQSLAPVLACAAVPGRAGRRQGRGIVRAVAPAVARAVALAGAMVLVEALRARWPFGGLPIASMALGQVAGPLSGASRVGGPLLLVGLVWLGGAAVGVVGTAALRWARWARGSDRAPAGWSELAAHAVTPPEGVARAGRPALLGPGVAGLVVLAAVSGVATGGALAPDGGPAVGTVRVATVQGGGGRGLHKSEVSAATVYTAQEEATAQIPSRDGGRSPQLVLWPEDVVPLDGPLDGSAAEARLADMATHLGATFVVGVTETVSATHFRNEVVAFAPTGRLVARFEKVHRVPFGEYVPFRSFFAHFADLSGVPLDAIPGHGDGVLRTPAGPLGTLVSFEIFYADRGRVATRAGAQLLIGPTNTASYATSQIPTQEIAAARLQAIAEGRDLVQAATTGFSALIDHRGVVMARSTLGHRQVIVGDVALRRGNTVYEQGGDVPVIVGAALLVVAGWSFVSTADPDPDRTEAGRRERRARAQRGGLRNR